jgi:hypothetical protein
MKITVEFDSEEEFKSRIKNPRGKGDPEPGAGAGQVGQQAPTPLMPPQQFGVTQVQPTAFTPPQAFPGTPTIDPAVMALVQRIATRLDAVIAQGQPVDTALGWLRGQCGAEASAATMDQIKTVFLPKLTAVGLEQIAKLIGA